MHLVCYFPYYPRLCTLLHYHRYSYLLLQFLIVYYTCNNIVHDLLKHYCSDLEEISESVLYGPSTMLSPPPPPPLLQEEDQLNLVARSLKRPTIPQEIQLTSTNFDLHISKYLKTVAVFCVKCK